MIIVDKRKLVQHAELGTGGMARVYRVGASVPQLPAELAYKELKPDVVDPVRTDLLDMMRKSVALRDAMTPAEQKELDSVAVWPLAMVQDNGVDVGLLMECIHDDFFIDAQPKRRVFEFQLLSAGTDQAKALGIEISRAPADKDLVRLALMARLAHVMEIIHRPRGNLRLVYGDLSLRNLAVAMKGSRILLMDCDGVADINDTARVQPNTPFFIPPELVNKQQKLQDQITDVYKLGLCVIRGMARGRGATQLSDPADPVVAPGLLDQAGIDLLNRAVGADRAQRPTAEEIKDYLVGRVLDLANPPELLSAMLSSNVALRGSEVFVTWSHKGGKTVRIYSDVSNFEVKGLDADGFPNGYPIKPPTACEIRVEVSNDHGAEELPAGRLDYYEIPALHIELVPPPVSLPDMPHVRLPRTHAQLPPYPMHPADAVPLPQPRWPDLPPLKPEVVAPQAAMVNGLLAAIGQAYKAAEAGIEAAVGDVLRQQAQQMRTDAEKQVSAGNPNPSTSSANP